MKRILLALALLLAAISPALAQQRRPVDNKHPMWLVHVDVWNYADPQKIINLIPDDIKPFVVMNLSLSCSYNKEKGIYERPNSAIRTYKSWASICQKNGMWFTCQPASGGHTHIMDDDLETFEYFFTHYPNFLGWNYAEQFWGFDEAGDPSSSSQASRLALFANLVPMHHKYGGFLTISFCGNIWSHPLNPVGMMKRNADLRKACEQYPESILWLYKYTTSSCFYNNESVCFGPFVAGLAKNYGVRYDNCGWNGANDALLGENHGKKYPVAAGLGTVMEQTCVNGGAVWDGPELIWTEDFQGLNNTSSNGYTVRNWGTYPGFENGWIDMFRQIIKGTLYIPTREEVVEKTKIIVINNVTSGSDEDKYAAWGDLYDNLYKVTDPFNTGNGQWMSNYSYMKSTGRYGAIPITPELWADDAKAIPRQVKKSARTSIWSSLANKKKDFDKYYPQVSTGNLYVNRYRNQLITYNPYSYHNSKRVASADIPLEYNTCESLHLAYYQLSSGAVHEYADHIDFYLNNYRTDTTTVRTDTICISGVTSEPSASLKKLGKTTATPAPQATITKKYDAEAATYTLMVKHMGPCQVIVNCQGNGTDRKTDYVPNEELTDLPVQPAAFHGPIVVEAEDMDFKNIANHVTFYMSGFSHVRNHSGNGFVVMGTNTAGSLQHILKNVPEAGEYHISVRYTNSSSNKTGTLTLKVGTETKTVDIKKTGTNEWFRTGATFNLKAGTNTLIVNNTKGINMTIDQVVYRPTDVEEEKFAITLRETENGVAVSNVAEAAEGETVKLEAIPNSGYRLASWRVVHGNVTVNANGTFTMPDEFVTLEPVFEDMTMVYQLDLANAANGGIPEGWKVTQENNDVHEYPNTYSSGSRVMKGFTGYQGAGLYWREKTCEYGSQSSYPLNLTAGKYKLTFAMAAWKGSPYYKVEILDSKNNVIAQGDDATTANKMIASPNANGNTGASVKTAKERTLSFEVTTAGKYIIRFSNYNDSDGYQEFLLLECKVNQDMTDVDGIHSTMAEEGTVSKVQPGFYNLFGMKMGATKRGINIIRTADGRTIKVLK